MPKPKAGLLSSEKISDSHQTVTPDAQIVVVAAKRDDAVTKIVISEVMNLGGGLRRLKFRPIPAGFKVTVRGRGSQQILYLYTNDPGVEHRIRTYFVEH